MMQRCTGIILAGGKSRRFGRDKALAEISGQTLLERAVDLLAHRCDEIIIVGRADANTDGSATVRTAPDVLSDIGPLGGILTGLSESKTELNMVLAVDMPFASVELFDLLLGSIGGADAAVPVSEERLQPLCAIYKRSCLQTLEAFISEGGRAVFGFLDRIEVRGIELRKSGILDDIDTREQLAEAEKRLAGEDT